MNTPNKMKTKDFWNWLEDNNASSAFKSQACDEVLDFLAESEFVNEVVIDDAFVWSDTKEGPKFWSELANELYALLGD